MRAIVGLMIAVAAAGCAEAVCPLDTSYDPAIIPAAFVPQVTNPLFALPLGTRFVYTAGPAYAQVDVLTERTRILEVGCTAVHRVVVIGGDTVEDTMDWYAQDRDGTVWHFGRDAHTLDHGDVTSTAGSWRAGVDGAKPGMIMPAAPVVDFAYRQDYSACTAEHVAKVIGTELAVTVQAGTFAGCIETEDTSLLDPDAMEHSYYCPGAGLVLTDKSAGARAELVEIRQ